MREDATSALLRALQDKFAGGIGFEEIVSRSWASATFVGARHEIVFTLDGAQAAAADGFVRNLAVEDFALRGHVLADIALVSEERTQDRTRLAIEALTVEDA